MHDHVYKQKYLPIQQSLSIDRLLGKSRYAPSVKF